LERDRHRLAGYYLRDAYYAYQRWGAGAKLSDMRRRYPDLLSAPVQHGGRDRATVSARDGDDLLTTGDLPDLDLETVLRASRAVGDEHEPSRLLERILSICLTYAGARRGFLILARGDELVVKAKGVHEEQAEVSLVSEAIGDQADLSHGIVHYVAKTSETVLLDDAAREGP